MNSKSVGYVSCIHIAGIPILPPLISRERQIEIENDREKAIIVEKRLKDKRHSTDSGVMISNDLEESKTKIWKNENVEPGCNNNCIFENAVRSDDFNNYEIEGVDDNFVKEAIADNNFKEFLYNNIINSLENDQYSAVNENECIVNYPQNITLKIGYFNRDHLIKKQANVSEPSNYICNNSTTEKPDELKETNIEDMLDVSVCKTMSLTAPNLQIGNNNICEVKSNLSQISLNKNNLESNTTRSPLVRRNSYVLDSPSPALLAHMNDNKVNCNASDSNYVRSPNIRDNTQLIYFPYKKSRKLWDRVKPKNLFKKYKNINICLMKNRSLSLTSLPNCDINYPLQRSSSVDCILSLLRNKISNESVLKSDLNLIQIVSNISPKNTSQNRNYIRTVQKEKVCNIICNSEIDSDDYLSYLDTYKPLVISQDLQNNFDVYNYKKLQDNYETTFRPTTRSDDCCSVCSSISSNKFINSTQSSPPSENISQLFSQLKIQHERQLQELLKRQEEEAKVLSECQSPKFYSSSDKSFHEQVINCSRAKSSCKKELFPKQLLEVYSQKELKAATLICAYARGFLTRRLLHTEKVQQIIETIRESLLCALSLRAESALKPMDLELNTRLIQQLTSACYDLHDVFSLSVTQRMAIIAADREIKQKRASQRKRNLQHGINMKTIKKPIQQEPRAQSRSYSSDSSYGNLV